YQTPFDDGVYQVSSWFVFYDGGAHLLPCVFFALVFSTAPLTPVRLQDSAYPHPPPPVLPSVERDDASPTPVPHSFSCVPWYVCLCLLLCRTSKTSRARSFR
ncbi:unnamed protein product, partial [Ectocarpus sp. 12 AP-2014]